MYIATFAHKGFTVSSEKMVTFDEMQLGSSLDTEKQDNQGKKPSTYIKGPGLNTFNIKVKLDAAFGVKPLEQINDWIGLKDKQTPYPFLLKGVPLLNTKWLLVDVQVSDTTIDNKGNMLIATVTLKFDEFSSMGKAKSNESTAKAKVSASSKSTTSKASKSKQSVYEMLKPSAKSALKTPRRNQLE